MIHDVLETLRNGIEPVDDKSIQLPTRLKVPINVIKFRIAKVMPRLNLICPLSDVRNFISRVGFDCA